MFSFVWEGPAERIPEKGDERVLGFMLHARSYMRECTCDNGTCYLREATCHAAQLENTCDNGEHATCEKVHATEVRVAVRDATCEKLHARGYMLGNHISTCEKGEPP